MLDSYFEICSKYDIPAGVVEECYDNILKNDPAHNVDHVYRVIQYGDNLITKINELMANGQMQFQLTPESAKCVILGCLMHDLGCQFDRDTHHLLSAGMAVSLLSKWEILSNKEIMIIAKACMEHRASYKGKHSSIVSELVAVADRGPIDVNEFINRTVKFAINKYGKDDQKVYNHAHNHIKEKIAKGGYAWDSYPGIGWYFNALEIYSLQQLVEDERKLSDKIITEIANQFTNL